MNRTIRTLTWKRKLLWGLLVSIVVLCVPELVLRLFLFKVEVPRAPTLCAWPAADAQMLDLGYFLQPDEDCFYDLRPGARYSYLGTSMDLINSAGFRGPEIATTGGNSLRIACFGDSSTFGMCVSEELTWVRQLQGLLRERHVGKSIETINAGVIGYTIVQGKRKYEHKLRKYRPAVALLAFGAINEQMPSCGASDVARAADWKRHYSSHVRGIADFLWSLRSVQFVLQGVLEARAKERTELLADCARNLARFDRGDSYPPRVSYEEFEQCLVGFVDELREDGCVPVLINPPRRASRETRYPQVVQLSEIILRVASDKEVPLFDGNRLFKQNPNHEAEYFADTHHPNARGNRVLAESLAEFLDRQDQLWSR